MLQQPTPTPMQEQLPSSSFSLTAAPICQTFPRFQPTTWKGNKEETRSVAAPHRSREEVEMRRVDCFCCHAVRGTEWATIYPQSPWPAGTIASQTPVLGCSRQKEIQHFTWKLVLVTYKKMQKARCEHFEEGILLSRHVREPATIFCSHHGNFSWYYFSTNLRPSVILKNIPLQDRKCI